MNVLEPEIEALLHELRSNRPRQPRARLTKETLQQARLRSERAQRRVEDFANVLDASARQTQSPVVDVGEANLLSLLEQLQRHAMGLGPWQPADEVRQGNSAQRHKDGCRDGVLDVEARESKDEDIDPRRLTNIVPLRPIRS